MNCWVKISQAELNGKTEVNLTRRNPTRLTMGIHLYFFKLPVGTTNITKLSLTKLWLGEVGGA